MATLGDPSTFGEGSGKFQSLLAGTLAGTARLIRFVGYAETLWSRGSRCALGTGRKIQSRAPSTKHDASHGTGLRGGGRPRICAFGDVIGPGASHDRGMGVPT